MNTRETSTQNYSQNEEFKYSRDGRSDFYPFNQPWLDEYYKSKGIE